MQLEYAKCFIDKSRTYFIERFLKTYSATDGKYVPFTVFPRQKVFLQNLAKSNNQIAIKHRQCGLTTLSSAWSTAQCVFAPKEAPETILCIGNKLDLAQQLVTKIREFLEQVPRWFWGDDFYSPDPKSEKNKRDIFVKNSKSELELFNGCRVYARSSGPNSARGISAVSILIFDEAAFIEDGATVYASAIAATSSNPNRRVILISTPNGRDSLYYNTYKQALAKQNGFTVTSFKWHQDLRYNRYLKWYKKDETTGEFSWDIDPIIDKKGNVKYDEERWERLEKDGWKATSPWYETMCQSFNNDSRMISQELDVSFEGSANNVVNQEFIDMQNTLNVREPLEDFKDPLIEETWFWKEPIEGHRYICACLPEGEQVLTQRGLVNVENVQNDDLLITKEGEFTKIKHRKYRNVENEDIVEIKVNGIIETFKFTYNHPIWASKHNTTVRLDNGLHNFCWSHEFEYVDASELSINDWICVPNFYRIHEKDEQYLLNYWKNFYKPNRVKKLNIECPLLDEDFWWYCGMWLAEGYYRKNNTQVATVHHIKENDYHSRIKDLVFRLFKRSATTTIKKENSCSIQFHSDIIQKFLRENFGCYAHGKYVAEWIKFIPKKYKLRLVEGYLNGDGNIYKGMLSGQSVSLKLLKDIQDILFSCGILCTIKQNSKEKDVFTFNKIVHKLPSFVLRMSVNYSAKFISLCGQIPSDGDINKIQHQNYYFSNDENYIFLKITNINNYQYSGKVYNFETESESHSFCCRAIATHNCDPSRGVSEDNTAIEIIDMDGRDENGMPIIEQVAEYLGKQLGDDIGGMLYQYATMYNNAFIIVDCTGGCGDAAILSLINMGYKNLYYDDAVQKTYTVQNRSKQLGLQYQDKLPGFHFQGNRFPVLSNFAGMVRNNEFKIRSIRVINELETWIFKGDTGRMDHMDSSHDDSITSLAMGLFVMRYSINKIQEIKNKDKAILNAYRVNGMIDRNPSYSVSPKSIDSRKKIDSPLIQSSRLKQYENIHGNFMWLFGK